MNDPYLLNELLFDLVILKGLYFFEDIYTVPEGTEFFIEVANSQNNNLLESLDFLTLFKFQTLIPSSLEGYKFNEDLTSSDQIVMNYLDLFEKRDLAHTNIILDPY